MDDTDIGVQDAFTLVEEGLTLLEDERRLLLSGAFTTVAALASHKAQFVARFESAAPMASSDPAFRGAVTELIRAAQRNEGLLKAAGEGLAAARRRFDALVATRGGAVAYDRDGSRILSRSDACGKSQCA